MPNNYLNLEGLTFYTDKVKELLELKADQEYVDDELTEKLDKVISTSVHPVRVYAVIADGTQEMVPGDSEATGYALIKRDANGRAKVAAPDDNADIANKQYVDNTLDSKVNKTIEVKKIYATNDQGAQVTVGYDDAPTASSIAKRNAQGALLGILPGQSDISSEDAVLVNLAYLGTNYYTKTAANALFDAKADLVSGKVPVAQLPTGAEIGTVYPGDQGAANAAAIGNLGTQLANEIQARESADATLTANINGVASDLSSEATARAAADTALGGRIDDEATARAAADTALGTQISNEESARSSADTALGLRIDGKADLVDGKVPAAQLPSYVDDVIEGYYNETNGKFYEHYESGVYSDEITPESGKIYINLLTEKTYRWGGSEYAEISASLALGETASTAYAGNKGKANADAIAEIPNLYIAKADIDTSIPQDTSNTKVPSTKLLKNSLAKYEQLPEKISDQADLAAMNPTGNYELTNDIQITAIWDYSQAFKGVLDGKGYTITITEIGINGGLFRQLTDGAEIKNLNIIYSNSTFSPVSPSGASASCIGGLAASVSGSSNKKVKIENVSVTASMSITSAGVSNEITVGGLIGNARNTNLSIKNCTFSGSISDTVSHNANSAFGGIVGMAPQTMQSLEIVECGNYADITAYCNVGGILGWSRRWGSAAATKKLTIEKCVNRGNITCTNNANVGGIVAIVNGYNTADGNSTRIINNINYGNVASTHESTANPAGICGNVQYGEAAINLYGNINYGTISTAYGSFAPIANAGLANILCIGNNFSITDDSTASGNGYTKVTDNESGSKTIITALNAIYNSIYAFAGTRVRLLWEII